MYYNNNFYIYSNKIKYTINQEFVIKNINFYLINIYIKIMKDKYSHFELELVVLWHWGIFFIKNIGILISVNLSNLEDYLELNHAIALKLVSVFLVNLFLFYGIFYSLIKLDIVSYQSIVLSSIILYCKEAFIYLQVIYIYYKEELTIVWPFVILVSIISLTEFISTYKIVQILGPISLTSAIEISNDSVIVNAYMKRNLLRSTMMGPLLFISDYIFQMLLWNVLDIPESKYYSELYILFLNYNYPILMFELICLFCYGCMFLLLYFNLDNESLFQRHMLLFVTIGSISSNFICLVGIIAINDLTMLNFNVKWISNIIYGLYMIYIIIIETNSIGNGLKGVLKNIDNHSMIHGKLI